MRPLLPFQSRHDGGVPPVCICGGTVVLRPLRCLSASFQRPADGHICARFGVCHLTILTRRACPEELQLALLEPLLRKVYQRPVCSTNFFSGPCMGARLTDWFQDEVSGVRLVVLCTLRSERDFETRSAAEDLAVLGETGGAVQAQCCRPKEDVEPGGGLEAGSVHIRRGSERRHAA